MKRTKKRCHVGDFRAVLRACRRSKRRERLPRKRDRLPFRCFDQLAGVYEGSLVWAYFGKGKKKAGEMKTN